MRLKTLLLMLALLVVSMVSAQDDMGTSFTVRVENIAGTALYENSGLQAVPVDADAPGPAMPGSAYEFSFSAGMSDSISFVTMLAQSNDLFFAPDEHGIALYDMDGNAVNGDVTDQVWLWDAGTEQNEPIGSGENQAPRQAAPNTGDDEMGVVQLASALDDGLSYPNTSDIISVTLSEADGEFTLRIENVSGDMEYASPITPVVWVVHSDMMGDDMMMGDDESMSEDDESMDDDMMMDDMMGTSGVFFTSGHPDRGQGLEAVAEDGDPATLFTVVGGSDFISPITPVVWAVHDGMMDGGAFFNPGEADRGAGLESVAEDGNPAALIASLEGMEYPAVGVAAIPRDASEAGPALPGSGYEFTITGSPGEVLSFVTMLVESNDLFFGSEPAGIRLFDDEGNPLSHDVTSHVWLWDAGTEVNEEPGVGANQPLRQAGPNTGDDEMGVVQLAADTGDGFSYPPVASIIRVTIHPDDMMMDG